jgi:hypothetical protein
LARKLTIFPLPQSPNCAPIITIVDIISQYRKEEFEDLRIFDEFFSEDTVEAFRKVLEPGNSYI